jgi:DNA-binding transcriptional MerR regulator
MNIGEVSQATGLPIKTIRYYEDMGLVTPMRQNNGYRVFDSASLERLRFLRRCRSLGFTIKNCAEMLAFHENPDGKSKQVRSIAEERLSSIEQTISRLRTIQLELKKIVNSSKQEDDPDFSILRGLIDHQTRLEQSAL